jgi:HAE1 family hydrophobic/amphiphilic exporter-1
VNISETFIRRPIATSLLMLAIALFGVLAYVSLPVADLPSVDFPTISVNAGLPGGDPVTMASTVASPLERQFTAIAGLDDMSSASSSGSSNITLQFTMDRDIEGAAVDVQTQIAAAMPLLPAGMPAPPSFRKTNPAEQPIVLIGLVSKTLPLSTLDDYAENLIAPRISMISGVAQVNVSGQQKYAVRVQVDPDKLRAQQIGLDDVDLALQNWNVNIPTGQLFGPLSTYNIRAGGQLANAEAFRPLVVAYRNGAPVRLSEVANVIDSVENTRTGAWLYSKDEQLREIVMMVTRQPGSNTIEIVDALYRLMPIFNAELPPSVHISVRRDRSRNIRQAFADVRLTMLVTFVLVVGVIYAFLHNGSATAIPTLALPFSILGTLAVMKLLHFSLNNLSMMALILSIGFIVDDAIVMLENIVRHMEAGEEPLAASLKGSKEIVYTILTMTTSLAAVFIPVLFMGGILGRLFREFAVTIMVAIAISGIVSVTLTPMLCSRFLRASKLHASGAFSRLMQGLFDLTFRFYRWSLGHVLRFRPVMLIVFVAVLFGTVKMFVIVPKGLIPDQDDDTVNVNLRSAQGTSYDEMVAACRRVGDVLIKNDNIFDFFLNIGGGAMNTASMTLSLYPRTTRPLTSAQIAQQVRPILARVANLRTAVSLPPALQIGARLGASSYAMTVQSANTDELYTQAARLESAIEALPQLQDVQNDMEIKSPRVDLVLNRDKAAAIGLDASGIETALYDGLGPKWSSTIYGEKSQYRVLLEIDPKYQQYADSLHKLTFKTSKGAIVPLESVVNLKETVGPQTVNHSGQLPAVTISFGLKPGVSLGEATDAIKDVASRMLPATVTTQFQGSAKVFQASLQNLGLLLFIAIGVVYIVLGMLYESYVHPITILSGLPSAGFGALVTLSLLGNELNIYSFVGLIMLIGIVKKNAIMQIDFALEAERQHGLTPAEAIYEGCLIRFRPIMMTTMAALFGALPIAIGFGTGGEARRPLGLAVAGGLIGSQFITLYLTPVIYTYLAALVRKPARLASPQPPPPALSRTPTR